MSLFYFPSTGGGTQAMTLPRSLPLDTVLFLPLREVYTTLNSLAKE